MRRLRTHTEDAAATVGSVPRLSGRRTKVVISAVLVAVGLGAVALAVLPGDEPTVRTADIARTTSNPTTTLAPAPAVFSDVEVTIASTSSTTTSTTTTTTTTSTTTTTVLATTVPETLPEQPPEPIAPPADPRGYEDQIQLGGISIPSLGVDAPLLEGIRLTTLDNGPGHWPGTALPGEVGNVVVAAHRTSHGGPFRNIDQLVVGDVVNFTIGGEVIEYSVTGTQIVNPDAIWIVDPTDTPTATLFACHPPGSVAQRIVVNLELSE